MILTLDKSMLVDNTMNISHVDINSFVGELSLIIAWSSLILYKDENDFKVIKCRKGDYSTGKLLAIDEALFAIGEVL